MPSHSVCAVRGLKSTVGARPAIQNRQFQVSYVLDSKLDRGKNVRDHHMVIIICIVISTYMCLYLQLFKNDKEG